jgi:hypothetical protein
MAASSQKQSGPTTLGIFLSPSAHHIEPIFNEIFVMRAINHAIPKRKTATADQAAAVFNAEWF